MGPKARILETERDPKKTSHPSSDLKSVSSHIRALRDGAGPGQLTIS